MCIVRGFLIFAQQKGVYVYMFGVLYERLVYTGRAGGGGGGPVGGG